MLVEPLDEKTVDAISIKNPVISYLLIQIIKKINEIIKQVNKYEDE